MLTITILVSFILSDKILYMSKSFYNADYTRYIYPQTASALQAFCVQVYSSIERFTANRIIIRALILLSR